MDAGRLNKLLPQTQCGACGYPGCQPYAEALAQKLAPINLCPPGGVETLNALGQALGIDPAPYQQDMLKNTRKPTIVKIIEADCVGCTKCITACPVDAIIGSAKKMHSIIAHECTGCGLCIEPCPVDCIEPIEQTTAIFDKEKAITRFHAKKIRQLQDAQLKEARYQEKRFLKKADEKTQEDKNLKQAYIEAALARVRAKKNE